MWHYDLWTLNCSLIIFLRYSFFIYLDNFKFWIYYHFAPTYFFTSYTPSSDSLHCELIGKMEICKLPLFENHVGFPCLTCYLAHTIVTIYTLVVYYLQITLQLYSELYIPGPENYDEQRNTKINLSWMGCLWKAQTKFKIKSLQSMCHAHLNLRRQNSYTH